MTIFAPIVNNWLWNIHLVWDFMDEECAGLYWIRNALCHNDDLQQKNKKDSCFSIATAYHHNI
jgi:hypothetical protein